MIQHVKAGIGSIIDPRFFFVFGFVLLIGSSGCKKEAAPLGTDLNWKTQDGFVQEGTIYTPKSENPPGLILVHAFGGGRHDWEYFSIRAQQHGYMVLAYDIRGHGDSVERNGEPHRYNRFDRGDWNRAIEDIKLAKAQLVAQGASPDNLFVVGASVGANMAVEYAAVDPEIQGIVLLSPGLEYKGIHIEETIKDNRRLPVLLMAAEGDRYSADTVGKMKTWSPSYTEVRTYAGTSHGTDLLNRSERIIEDIFVWLKPIVKD